MKNLKKGKEWSLSINLIKASIKIR
jgi:hypothetical protein